MGIKSENITQHIMYNHKGWMDFTHGNDLTTRGMIYPSIYKYVISDLYF